MRPGDVLTGRVLMAAACLTLVACDDDGGESSPAAAETTPSTVPTTTAATTDDDDVLRIGLLLPRSGEAAMIGQPLIDAALVAAEAVNTAGGVLGQPVVVSEYDEGNDEAAARDAIASLIEADVDAVVGPASSTIALATLADLLSADILTCSPTATAMALDEFPDSGLFIRTAPSDSLQTAELAELADDTGARSVAVTYLDDPYGRALGKATIDALGSRGLAVEEEVAFSAQEADSLVDEANLISSSGVDVVIVLGDGEHGARMLSEIGEATGIVPGELPPDIFVNDAVRNPPSPQLIQELATEVREQITGLSPLAIGPEEGEPQEAFATNAADCVNLIALAAVAAESDDAEVMVDRIADVSDSGLDCRTFAECVQLIDAGRNINYDGPGGVVRIGPGGDPLDARFDRFGFDENGDDVSKAAAPAGQPVNGN